MILTLPIDIIALICLWLDNFALRNLLICCRQSNYLNQQTSFWLKLITLANLVRPLNLVNYDIVRSYYVKTYFNSKLAKLNITNLILINTHLFDAKDFDLFLLSITSYKSIPYSNNDIDRRDNFTKLFKLIDFDRVKQFIVNSDLRSIVNIERVDVLSNLDLVKLYFNLTKDLFICNTRYAYATIDSFNNNDLATFKFLYYYAKSKDHKFVDVLAKIVVEANNLDLFIILCNYGLNLLKLLQDHALTIPTKFYGYIINKHYLTLLKYLKSKVITNFKSCFKVYSKISDLPNTTDIKFLLLDHLFNLPISKYHTTEDEIIKKIQAIVNSFTTAEEFIDLYYFY